MALWFPLMVNGSQIGEVSIVRRDDPEVDGCFTYDWSVTRLRDPKSLTRYRSMCTGGDLVHSYDDGAFELVRKVLQAYAGKSPQTA